MRDSGKTIRLMEMEATLMQTVQPMWVNGVKISSGVGGLRLGLMGPSTRGSTMTVKNTAKAC